MITATITRPATPLAWLQALAGALTTTHRPDGTAYVHLSDAAYWEPIRSELQAICRAAHRGEMPNDWRWDVICDGVQALLEYAEPYAGEMDQDWLADLIPEVADRLADVGYSALAAWVADVPSRAAFDDEGIAPECTDIMRLLHIRQCEEIALTLGEIVWALPRG